MDLEVSETPVKTFVWCIEMLYHTVLFLRITSLLILRLNNKDDLKFMKDLKDVTLEV